jgi:Bacterial regulatory helix-turn-helix protein, lysR family
VVEEGNFHRAAARLHISPLTLSRQTQALDHELGGRLLGECARGLTAQRFGCGKLTALFPLEIRPSPVETSDKDEQDRRTEHN